MGLQKGGSTQRRKGKSPQRTPSYTLRPLPFPLSPLREKSVWVYKKRFNAKTQMKKPAKDAQLHFEISAFPFEPFARKISMGLQKAVQRKDAKEKARKGRPATL
jgi:hypothetical protein